MKGTLSDRGAYVLALWFGCGCVPLAPGTAGSLGALPVYWALRPFGEGALLAAALVIGLVGIRAADVVALHTGLHDPQVVVIDEVAGTLLTLTAAPATTKGVAAAFFLFRMLDQCKPWPAGWAERRLSGGLGIMLDDVVAGVWGAFLLVLLRRFSWIEALLS